MGWARKVGRGEGGYSPPLAHPARLARRAREMLADFLGTLLAEQDGIEWGSVHMQAIGVLNESELLEPIHKKTHS